MNADRNVSRISRMQISTANVAVIPTNDSTKARIRIGGLMPCLCKICLMQQTITSVSNRQKANTSIPSIAGIARLCQGLKKGTHMSNTQYIYTLADPFTMEIRYVGRTVEPEERLKGHIYQTNGGTDKDVWIISLRNANTFPVMAIVETVTAENGAEREKKWIKHYLKQGSSLFNKTHNKPELTIIGYTPKKYKTKAAIIADCIQGVVNLPKEVSPLDRWVLIRLIYLCKGEETPIRFTLVELAEKVNVSVKGLSISLERLTDYGLITNLRKRTIITVHIMRLLEIKDGATWK